MLHNEMLSCIEACTQCHAMCLHTLEHCLNKGGNHAEAGHIRDLLDCAQICSTSADFMNRGSPRHVETCRACAVICEQCVQSCARLNDDEHMLRCLDACRHCAALCHEMSGALA